jgi:hypothetical protein
MDSRIVDANWTVHWKMTESAGLQIYLADFRGTRVLWEASLPYVTIDHLPRIADSDSGSGGRGPLWAPLGLRSQVSEIHVDRYRGGFELTVDFAVGPYRYTQLWRFQADGRFAPWLTIHGPGIHEGHTYHAHWRFDFDLAGAQDDAFEYWENRRWQRVAQEGWFPDHGAAAPEGGVWRQVDCATGSSVTIRPYRREDGEVFAIRYRDGDAAPYYPHSELRTQAYPAAYVGDAELEGRDVILWYAGHIHYSGATPVTAGPWVRVGGI